MRYYPPITTCSDCGVTLYNDTPGRIFGMCALCAITRYLNRHFRKIAITLSLPPEEPQ